MTKAGQHVKKCKAKSKRTGAPCGSTPLAGMEVCRMHGGAAPQAKRKARERLEEAADRMARELLKMASDANVSESVRLAAIRDALSRAGVSERTAVDVTHELKPWEQILDGAAIESGSRAEYRASVGRPDPEPLPAIENQPRPGGPRIEASGVRVIGELPDGSLVIDVDQADDDTGDLDDARQHDDATEAHRSARQTFANSVVPLTPVRGYLPAEEAQTVAAEANRAYRRGLTRR
jgi:hypothetical protein